MYNAHERKSFFRFAVVILMVVILVTFFMIIFLRKRASDQLSAGVRDLVATKTDASHIDQAMQLLYASDNDFRFYTLTYDPAYLHAYVASLEAVSAHIDTAIGKASKQQQVQDLLADKEEKTQLFLHTRLYVDSLLQLSQQWDTTATPVVIQELKNIRLPQREQIDTIITSSSSTVKPKKKLLGRIKDAISNKAAVQTNQEVKVIKRDAGGDGQSSVISSADLKKMQQRYQQFMRQAAQSHANLNRKEYALVMANQRLFNALQQVLVNLRKNMVTETDKKRWMLSQHIGNSLNRMDKHTYWEIPLLLLLTAIIIYGIIRLYKYDLVLLRSKQQAEEFARLKSEFASTMSHEIRTPIHSLLGYTSQLEGDQPGETASAIRNSAEMLLSVVNNVLDYTQMEGGKPQLKQEKFSPRTAIEDICNSLQVQAKIKSLVLQPCIYFPTTQQVYGDVFRLKQVLMNLIANAIKYTGKGAVTVTAYLRDGELLQVSVKDTGSGIPAEELPTLFDAFTQGRNGISKGSGLGLHIAKKIIDLHDGKIEVKSTPGKGTTFYFEIRYPAVVQTPGTVKITMPVNNTTESSATPATPAHIRLLVVEDSVLNQKLLSLLLDRLGIAHVITGSAEEALAIYAGETFDMVLTDIDLPGMDGIALTQQIRRMPDKKKAGVTIIAITGNVLDDDVASYMSCGLNDYIMKPYREEDILEKISAHGLLV
ncbi:ATP-binding protein [Chitinophaga qingshengii]|uniref:histidine kinase n=1 Tax=Chitinophaga qingshengii TaxID=1569794 RepID=A0ABR7TG20_9BACT|nr:ATP-binding protein [Chitinophaga qingshengii]MBC9929348.1 response regulator [Chitinophaga qingshengii]